MGFKKTLATLLVGGALAFSGLTSKVKAKDPNSWGSGLNEGLVAYFDFNEISGNTLPNLIDNSNYGALRNMEDNNWVNGKLGNSLYFDGSDDYVQANNIEGIVNDVSVSFWAKTIGYGGGHPSYIFLRETGAGVAEPWSLIWNHVGVGNVIAGSDSIIPNKFQHIIVTQNTNLMNSINTKIYIDGINKTTNDTYADFISYSGGVYMAHTPPKWYLNTIIDEVGIWNRVLTSDEVRRLYNNGEGLPLGNYHKIKTLKYDFNDDGIVNLLDFAMFTSEWLKREDWYGQ